MTYHCPRSNWTGPESELRKGICPKCAESTLYEDCRVRPVTITNRTHAHGCLYTTSSSARCTCHWAKVIAEEEARK
jgi:hypothetical protein